MLSIGWLVGIFVNRQFLLVLDGCCHHFWWCFSDALSGTESKLIFCQLLFTLVHVWWLFTLVQVCWSWLVIISVVAMAISVSGGFLLAQMLVFHGCTAAGVRLWFLHFSHCWLCGMAITILVFSGLLLGTKIGGFHSWAHSCWWWLAVVSTVFSLLAVWHGHYHFCFRWIDA